MGTAAKRRTAAKREQITVAARRLFLTHGYAGTSMDAVVSEAGVSKQTLYRYFSSKADLLAAILTDEMQVSELFPSEQQGPSSPDDLRTVLLTVAHGVTQYLLHPENVGLTRLIFGEAFRIPELRDGLRNALPGQLLERITGLLARAHARGLIHAPRPDLTARLFLGPVFSFVALDGYLRSEPLPPPPFADLEYLVDIFLTAVEAPR